MFAKLKQRWQDTRTIMKLSLDAEQRALQEGQQHPGAEHYTLAALDLPDGSARRVFARIGADPEAYRAALANRHAAALNAIGVAAPGADAASAASGHHTRAAADQASAASGHDAHASADAASAAAVDGVPFTPSRRADGAAPLAEPTVLFDAQPSGQALMQSLPELQRRLPAPLCGAHVLLAAASMAHSAAGRAFKAIGIDLQALGRAAEAELRAAIPA
ncbi:Clp protease N-terminal domain-containing protein [Duganella sp.]|uniref:Clp protease N-terminal domain-containing protein n=1 Tax=Duganella sp. TaxID=1904440 RepID=UPI0031D74335